MRNIKLTIEYDRKDFNRWQKQNNKINIQDEIERAIEEITGESINLIASGRTDAGVHSLGQVANFKTSSNIPLEKIPIAINTKLKRSIRIINAEEVNENFHSRYSCKKKTYKYIINNSENGTAVYRNLQYNFSQKLNEIRMNEAMQYFMGEHDFRGFKASGTSSKSSVRKIYSGSVNREKDLIIIQITGNGFLYNMVRIIAGTLVEVGLGKIKPEEIEKIIDKGDRQKAGKTLPPQGLYLVSVDY